MVFTSVWLSHYTYLYPSLFLLSLLRKSGSIDFLTLGPLIGDIGDIGSYGSLTWPGVAMISRMLKDTFISSRRCIQRIKGTRGITQSTTRQVAVAVAVRMAMNDLLDGSILCGSIYTLYIVVAACQSVALRACGSTPVSAQRNYISHRGMEAEMVWLGR